MRGWRSGWRLRFGGCSRTPCGLLHCALTYRIIDAATEVGVIAVRPLVNPETAAAQSNNSYLYIEPGTTTLRSADGSTSVEGKVIIDLRNGNVWGTRHWHPCHIPWVILWGPRLRSRHLCILENSICRR